MRTTFFRKLPALKLALTAALLLCFAPPAVHALDLTWDQAWLLAQRQNTDVLSAREELITARELVNEARSAALPAVSLSGLYTRNLKSPVFFIDGQPIRIGLDNSYAAQLEIAQPIWVAGKVGTALRAARAYVRQSNETVEQTLQNVRVDVARSFYGVVLFRELVTTAETSLLRAQQHRDQARLMYAQGVVSEYDKIRAEVQAANMEPPLLQARNQYLLAVENLHRLLRLDPADSLHVIGELALGDTLLPPADLELAYAQRSELQALQYTRQIQRQLLSLARRDLYLPSFYAAFNYQTQAQADNFAFHDYSWANSSAAMLQASLPLFDGFRTPAKIKQHNAALRRLDYTEADVRSLIRIDVENSRRELQRALRVVAVQADNVREAQRGYDIANVRYKNGTGTQLELLDSELQLDHARVNRLQALYDARIARIQLERALGMPLDNSTDQ